MRSLTPVSFVRDPAARRAVITAAPGTPWIRFTEAVLAEVQADPQIADWNIIIDDQGPMQDVDVDGMIRMGEAFCKLAARPEDRTFTVVVTQDPLFAIWARVIDMNYSGRRRHGAPTLGEARRVMDRLEPSGGLCPQGKGPGNGRQQSSEDGPQTVDRSVYSMGGRNGAPPWTKPRTISLALPWLVDVRNAP